MGWHFDDEVRDILMTHSWYLNEGIRGISCLRHVRLRRNDRVRNISMTKFIAFGRWSSWLALSFFWHKCQIHMCDVTDRLLGIQGYLCVLQCVAACDAVWCSVLQCVAVCCNTLQHTQVSLAVYALACYNGAARTRTDAHTYVRAHVHTYMHTYIHTYIHTHIHTYTHTYIHSSCWWCSSQHTSLSQPHSTHTYWHAYVYVHTHTYIYTYIHTYTGTHIHIYSGAAGDTAVNCLWLGCHIHIDIYASNIYTCEYMFICIYIYIHIYCVVTSTRHTTNTDAHTLGCNNMIGGFHENLVTFRDLKLPHVLLV